MTTVNNRVYSPQAHVINGVDAGGAMSVLIDEGYENIIRSAPDGMVLAVLDREIQYVRGRIVSQDWVHLVDLMTGTVGTYVFNERKSGVAAATGYVKHSLKNPKIWNARLVMNKRGYMTVEADFECMAADETEGIKALHTMTDDQAAPTYVTAARGGWRVKTTVHDALSVYHVTAFDFALTAQILKACNDADIGYTAVDVREDAMRAAGSLSFEDAAIKTITFELKAQELLVAAAASLVITVVQSQGAADKVITIARTMFVTSSGRSDVNQDYSGYTTPFEVTNDPATPLTLDGANPIIAIA